ncbi:MAG: class I SAM-dependent methyltransferase [Nanoarchaeota archaeon]
MGKISEEEVWDTIAEKWEEFRKRPVPEVLEFLKDKKGKILDLGCGTGRHLQKINGIKFFGIDFSEKMLRFAEKKIKKENIEAVLVKSDMSKLPFSDDYFDYAIFIRSLHCIPSKKAREKSLRELYRVLKPKAKSLIQVWSKSHERLKNKEKGDYIPWTINNRQIQRYYYIYEQNEIQDLLEKVGFKILKINEDKNITIVVEK